MIGSSLGSSLGSLVIGSYRLLSDSVLFRVLNDGVLFRDLSDTVLCSKVLFRVLSDTVLFRDLSVRVLSRVFSYRFPLSALGPQVFSKVLSPRFPVCRVSSVTSRTWGVFALIFCFKYFNTNRCFDSFFGKFNVITGNLDKFLTRLHPRFLTGFWIGCIQKFHPQVFQKIGLVKFLEKCPWRSSFQKGYRSNIGLFHRCYPVKQLLLIF